MSISFFARRYRLDTTPRKCSKCDRIEKFTGTLHELDYVGITTMDHGHGQTVRFRSINSPSWSLVYKALIEVL